MVSERSELTYKREATSCRMMLHTLRGEATSATKRGDERATNRGDERATNRGDEHAANALRLGQRAGLQQSDCRTRIHLLTLRIRILSPTTVAITLPY